MSKRWTQSDIDKLRPGMVHDNQTKKVVETKAPVHAKSTNTTEKAEMALAIYAVCRQLNIPVRTEYYFLKERRYRFDWALPTLMIAIEYEGLNSLKSGHTTFDGYTNNCKKYNLAVKNGWQLLRYTFKNYQQAGADLLELIEKTITLHERNKLQGGGSTGPAVHNEEMP